MTDTEMLKRQTADRLPFKLGIRVQHQQIPWSFARPSVENLFEDFWKIVPLVAVFVYNCGMGGSVNFPVGRDGFSATVSVADQLDALILPSVFPVEVAVPGWVGLPDFPASEAGWRIVSRVVCSGRGRSWMTARRH